jgi:hypothetical protein
MFLLNPRFFVLPLAALLIICALPRAQRPSSPAVVGTHKAVFKASLPKLVVMQPETERSSTM